MKKKSIIFVSILALVLVFTGVSLSQLGYKGKTVTNGSAGNVIKALEIAEQYQEEETVRVGDQDISRIAYEIAKANRNGSDEETKKYFIRVICKDKVIQMLAKDYQVSISKEELDTYMNESFAAFTESEKSLLAAMEGFSNFEDYAKSPRAHKAAELFLLENQLIQAMTQTKRDQVTTETYEKLVKEALAKLEEAVEEEIKKSPKP